MEQLTMSNREIDKLKVIQNTIDGKYTWPQAAEILRISERQVGRLCARVREEGNRGIIHGLKGLPSNNKLPEALIEEAIGIVRQHFADFGPTLANEHLLDDYKIRVSTNTLRKAMIVAELYKPKTHKPKHRNWRERRACVGMLVQLDGSEHDWFEGRGPKCALLVFIDDATSRILYARFITVEDTINLMRCAKDYLKINGRPVAIYVDKDSIYKINRQASIDEELRDAMPLSQFTRAMGEFGAEMIFANSPQAKGRVERGFRTHQDRLVKELRLAGISDMAAANKFLETVYIAKHNEKFAVAPASRINAHRPLLKTHRLDEILCVKLNRTLANDYTLRFDNNFFQVTKDQDIRIRPRDIVTIEQWLDGSIHLKFKGVYLQHKRIKKLPYRGYYATHRGELTRPAVLTVGTSVPGKNHPWRRFVCTKKLQMQGGIRSQPS